VRATVAVGGTIALLLFEWLKRGADEITP